MKTNNKTRQDVRLLITGFEPFGGETINPAKEILDRIDFPACGSIMKKLLPVSYSGARNALIEVQNSFKPTHILSIGQAGGRKSVTPEFCALNIMSASIPDNDGVSFDGAKINPDECAENAFFSSLNLNDLTYAVTKETGVPCTVSYHAGTFVCNTVYYTDFEYSMKESKNANLPPRVLFVHVPFADTQLTGKPDGTPFLPLEDSLKAIISIGNLLIAN